jgi:penicillin-binding protein 2
MHGISNSCNSYFCQTFRRILENSRYGSIADAYDKWKGYLNEFGFGKKLGIELSNELPGLVPSTSYFDRYYGKNRWKALTVISMAIGQGEIGTTPLQMANMTAAIANRGYYYIPHVVKSIGKDGKIDQRFLTRQRIGIDSVNFEEIICGMEEAVNGQAGATARIAALKDIMSAVKPEQHRNPHGKDHLFLLLLRQKMIRK